jgi:hypothetical protein
LEICIKHQFAGSASFYEFQWEPLAETHFPLISQIECARINAEKIQTKKDTAEAPLVRRRHFYILHWKFSISPLACLYNFKSIYIDDHKHATPLGFVVQGLVILLLTCSPAGAGAIDRNSSISAFCVSSGIQAGPVGANTFPADIAD